MLADVLGKSTVDLKKLAHLAFSVHRLGQDVQASGRVQSHLTRLVDEELVCRLL